MSFHWSFLKWGCLILAFASLIVAAWFVWQNTTLLLQTNTSQTQQAAKSVAIDAPLIVERDGERIVWRLRATKAQQLPSGMRLTKPSLELFTGRGEVVMIHSDIAIFNPLKRNIDFRHHVKTSYKDWLLTTERLLYLSRQDMVLVPDAFNINGADAHISGKGLHAERKTEKVYIEHDVRVRDLQRHSTFNFTPLPQQGNNQ